jgi:hypothetical protein
MITKKQ